MKIEERPIEEIKPYEKNAKLHSEKQVKKVADSINKFGWTQPIVVDMKGVIIAGHCRYIAAQLLGLEKVPVFEMDLDEEKAKTLRLLDNKLNESPFDMDIVIGELKSISLEMVNLTGFDQDLIIENKADDDNVPSVPKIPKSRVGDIYQLGSHRILCGDSTKIGDVEKLMDGKKCDVVVTDPPYNTGMDGENKDAKARLSHMFNDNIENWQQFLETIFSNYCQVSKEDCAFYVFIDWRSVQDIRKTLESLMDVKNVIVWDKQVHGLGSDYKFTYELCVVGKRGKPEINNRYGTDYQDIWRVQRKMGRNEDHATAKPVELLEKPIIHASKQGDIVLDLFLGSGTTLIASDRTGRICYGMELDEKYVDVIVQRYVDCTGSREIIKNGEKITW